jgi:hypothetical protein
MFIQNFMMNFSHKTLKIKVSQPKDEAWKYTSNAILKMTLPFFKKKDYN